MRPLVPSCTALAVVALCGALATGASTRSSEREGPASSGADGATGASRAFTPGFYGGTLPETFAAGVPGRAGTALPDGSTLGSPPPRLLRAPPAPQEFGQSPLEPHEFYFTRAIYSDYRRSGLRNFSRRGYGYGSWHTDAPTADRIFVVMIDHLLGIDLYMHEHFVALDDPEIRHFPFLYALEVGAMNLTEAEVHGLRDYLAAGGFLVIDDFWGTYEWQNWEQEISRVLPGRPMVELSLDDPIFHTFYDIDEILQVPNVNNAKYGNHTWEKDGYVPHVLGIYDDHNRLMVVINWNTDLGDAWEWADDPYYPLKYSRFAAEMGINMIVYGMSH